MTKPTKWHVRIVKTHFLMTWPISPPLIQPQTIIQMPYCLHFCEKVPSYPWDTESTWGNNQAPGQTTIKLLSEFLGSLWFSLEFDYAPDL